MIENNIDEYGDSFARDVRLDELREVMGNHCTMHQCFADTDVLEDL